jgi:hypothetical protein
MVESIPGAVFTVTVFEDGTLKIQAKQSKAGVHDVAESLRIIADGIEGGAVSLIEFK